MPTDEAAPWAAAVVARWTSEAVACTRAGRAFTAGAVISAAAAATAGLRGVDERTFVRVVMDAIGRDPRLRAARDEKGRPCYVASGSVAPARGRDAAASDATVALAVPASPPAPPSSAAAAAAAVGVEPPRAGSRAARRAVKRTAVGGGAAAAAASADAVECSGSAGKLVCDGSGVATTPTRASSPTTPRGGRAVAGSRAVSVSPAGPPRALGASPPGPAARNGSCVRAAVPAVCAAAAAAGDVGALPAAAAMGSWSSAVSVENRNDSTAAAAVASDGTGAGAPAAATAQLCGRGGGRGPDDDAAAPGVAVPPRGVATPAGDSVPVFSDALCDAATDADGGGAADGAANAGASSGGPVAVLADDAAAAGRPGFVPFAEQRHRGGPPVLFAGGGAPRIHLNAVAPMCVVAMGADAECHGTMAACLAALRRVRAPAPPTSVVFFYSADALAAVQCASIPAADVLVSPDFAVQRCAFYARRGVAARPLALQWGTLSASDVRTLLRLGATAGGDGCCAAALAVLVGWQRAGATPAMAAACDQLAGACGCRAEGRLGCAVAVRVADLRAFVSAGHAAAPGAASRGSAPGGDRVATAAVLDAAAVPRGSLVVVDLTDPMLCGEFACAVFTVLMAQFRGVADDTPLASEGAGAAPALVLALEGAHTTLTGAPGGAEPLAEALMSAARSIHTLPAAVAGGDTSVRCSLSVLVSTQLPRVLPLDLMDVATLVLLHRLHSRDWLAWLAYKLPLGAGAEGALAGLRPLGGGEEALLYAPHHAVAAGARERAGEELGDAAFRVRLLLPRAHMGAAATAAPAPATPPLAAPSALVLPALLPPRHVRSPSERVGGSLASASECGLSDCGGPCGAAPAPDLGRSFGALSSASGGSVCSSGDGSGPRAEPRTRYSNAPIDPAEFGAEVLRLLRAAGGGPVMCSNLAYAMPERLRPRRGFQQRAAEVPGVVIAVGEKANASFSLTPEAMRGDAPSPVAPDARSGEAAGGWAGEGEGEGEGVQAVGGALQAQIEALEPLLSRKITGMILGLGLAEAAAVAADGARLRELVAEAVAELARAGHT